MHLHSHRLQQHVYIIYSTGFNSKFFHDFIPCFILNSIQVYNQLTMKRNFAVLSHPIVLSGVLTIFLTVPKTSYGHWRQFHFVVADASILAALPHDLLMVKTCTSHVFLLLAAIGFFQIKHAEIILVGASTQEDLEFVLSSILGSVSFIKYTPLPFFICLEWLRRQCYLLFHDNPYILQTYNFEF